MQAHSCVLAETARSGQRASSYDGAGAFRPNQTPFVMGRKMLFGSKRLAEQGDGGAVRDA